MKMQRSQKGISPPIQKSSSCEELLIQQKNSAFTQSSSCSYKSTDDLPASVAECFQDSSLLGRIQNNLLLLIGRGSRYKIINTKGCSLFSMINHKKTQEETSILFPEESKPSTPILLPKTALKQVNSLPVRPKTTSPAASSRISQKTSNICKAKDIIDSKYTYIDKEEHPKCDEDTLRRQYISLQQLAIARRHCNQLRCIRDSLVGRAHPKAKRIPPTKEQEELRNFLMNVGFVQYYVLLNRHGYDFETASHMNALDLAAVGITEPLHRMALKYELDQVRQPIKSLETIPETIAQWLESISLPEYIEHFQQNGFYCPLAAVGLTKRDLQLMGIYMLGHRKKIVLALTAIGMSLSCKSFSKLS